MSPQSDFDFQRPCVPAGDETAADDRPASTERRRGLFLRAVIGACGHHLILATAALVRIASAGIRWIPTVRQIDAAREVRLKELEVESERLRLAADLDQAQIQAAMIVALTAIEKTDPALVPEIMQRDKSARRLDP